MQDEEVKEYTANQLYKKYKDDGGSLKFANWLTREKKKGIFPLNSDLNEEVYMALNGLNENKSKGRVLGFPTSTLWIMGGVIIGAIIVAKLIKKK
jgi:hypothetical protein